MNFVAMDHHFGHSVETMIKVYSHFLSKQNKHLFMNFMR